MRTLCFLLTIALPASANEDFFEAARKGDTAALKSYLDKGVPVDSKWRYGQTALFIAARRGNLEAARLLIDRGADVNAQDSFYNMSALVSVAQDGKAEMVKLLLDNGAKGKEEILAMTAGQGKAPVVKAILDSGGLTAQALAQALVLAESGKRTEVVDLLKKAGAVKPATPPPYNIDSKLLSQYAGTYRNERGNEQVFDVAEGKLRGSVGGRWVPYNAMDNTTFEPVQYPGMWKAVFITEGEKVKALEYRSAQGVERFARVEAK